jgi:pyruvate kinase
MQLPNHRTKVVATIGPASNSPEIIRKLIKAGMAVARLNFSHGSYEDHAQTIRRLREASEELEIPVTLLQDLQGPKVRVGHLEGGSIHIEEDEILHFLPVHDFRGEAGTLPIDYPYLAEEAETGARVLLDDGLLEMVVESIATPAVTCRVVRGGILKSRKGVNLPSLDLRLPSLTEKDQLDLEFGLSQGVDWVALSFVRRVEDVRALREVLERLGASDVPVLAKIEKPQAVAAFDAIVKECDGIMVARGDLGVEVNPEKVPLIQKRLIRTCNQRGIPVITATQMLDSMIKNPRPTRAEASDVANAILDGTDAVMLSGESAVGDYPVEAVAMMVKIAQDVEPTMEFPNQPPAEDTVVHAITEAINVVDNIINPRCITAYTTSGYTASLAAAERPSAPILAFTPTPRVYTRLNLHWGVTPILMKDSIDSVEDLADHTEYELKQRGLVSSGDKLLILGGSPLRTVRGTTNFLKIHVVK